MDDYWLCSDDKHMGGDLLIDCITLYGCLRGIIPWSTGDKDNLVTPSCNAHMGLACLLRRMTSLGR